MSAGHVTEVPDELFASGDPIDLDRWEGEGGAIPWEPSCGRSYCRMHECCGCVSDEPGFER